MQNIVNQIKSFLDHEGGDINMQSDRPYSGQPHTIDGIRGSQLINGITMRDIRDAYIRAVIISHPCYKEGTLNLLEPNYTLNNEAKKGPNACICGNDLFTLKGNADPIAIIQNLTCELEKLMGIFPNIPGYNKIGYEGEPTKNSNYILSDIEKRLMGDS